MKPWSCFGNRKVPESVRSALQRRPRSRSSARIRLVWLSRYSMAVMDPTSPTAPSILLCRKVSRSNRSLSKTPWNYCPRRRRRAARNDPRRGDGRHVYFALRFPGRHQPDRQGGRLKEYVLVVDDEQSLRQVLELFFRKEGFEVDTASSLAEAEDAISANAYDLVLTDLRMARPDDGLKVLRAAVRKNPWTQVIVLTAYATVEMAKEAIRYGAYDYLTKPFDNVNLRKLVRAALARK